MIYANYRLLLVIHLPVAYMLSLFKELSWLHKCSILTRMVKTVHYTLQIKVVS